VPYRGAASLFAECACEGPGIQLQDAAGGQLVLERVIHGRSQ
jgi:hypothetical protein